MALPNFLCVGAEKAGTTPLFSLLSAHPDIFVPEQKETHYFSVRRHFLGLVSYEANDFQDYAGQHAIGELTPEYMRVPNVAETIRDVLGQTKIIICVREPVARAFSHYHQCVRILQENRSFEQACKADAGLSAKSSYAQIRTSYVTGSHYAEQIRAFINTFGGENVFYCVLERDFENKIATLKMLRRLCQFLGVSSNITGFTPIPNSSLPCPKVQFIERPQKISFRGRATLVEPGDIVFRTGNAGLDRVIHRPSQAAREFFAVMARDITTELSCEFATQLAKRFAGVTEQVSNLIGRDLTDSWAR